MAELLKGNKISKQLMQEIKNKVKDFKEKGINPSLAIVLSGSEEQVFDPASLIYANMILKKAQKAGVQAKIKYFPIDLSQVNFIKQLDAINKDDDIHGIIVMLPLPKHIEEQTIISSINQTKDIDGVNPYNAGCNLLGIPSFMPSTAQACFDMLLYSGIETSGKDIVILGRSNIVGKPLANMLMQKVKGGNATVTVCHSRTKNLKEICQKSDILIAAIGQTEMITSEYVHSNQILLDVGMNQKIDEHGQPVLCGDINFSEVEENVKAITPVPGGISPLTHTALLNNLLKAIEKQKSIN